MVDDRTVDRHPDFHHAQYHCHQPEPCPIRRSQNYIRFRVTETGGAGSISPAYLLRVDATPPASPQSLIANPATWTNAGSFTVSWTNPPDVAGIAGAWYKLDSPPTSPLDGTFVMTSNSITGISAGTPGVDDGAHPVYVWLQDILGRADPKTASSHHPLLGHHPRPIRPRA